MSDFAVRIIIGRGDRRWIVTDFAVRIIIDLVAQNPQVFEKPSTQSCRFCCTSSPETEPMLHDQTCVWVRARKLVAQAEQERAAEATEAGRS